MSQYVSRRSPSVARREPRVILIAALAANRVIGAKGGLPWRLPEDLKHFKRITRGHPVIMGRKTWQSIGQPLPERRNIVVTRQTGFAAPGAQVAASLEAALALCAGEPVAYVIGGEALYRAALACASEMQLTEIHRSYEGDARFPEFDRTVWRETARDRHTAADGMPFDFVTYERAR